MAEANEISQASVVPYRFGEAGIEFCLITTRKSQRWGFPKGRIHSDESPDEAALHEAREEAGLTGRIVGKPIGKYVYKKKRRKQRVTVMLMVVDGCDDEWQESNERQRRWASLEEARLLLDRPNLIHLLQRAVELLRSNPPDSSDGTAISA